MTREKALEVLNTYDMSEDNSDREFIEAIQKAIEALKNIGKYRKKAKRWKRKALAIKPKGHWITDIDHSRGFDWRRFYCSECREWQTYGKTAFCCSCGAEMESEDE